MPCEPRPERENSDEVGLGDPAAGRSTGPRRAAAALSFLGEALVKTALARDDCHRLVIVNKIISNWNQQNGMGFASWAGWSWVSFFSALLLSYQVLSAGYAKVTYQTPPSQVADEIRKKYFTEDKEDDSSRPYFSPSTARIRDVRGVIEIICGILLLVPSWRRLGAAIAFSLLIIGLVSRIRSGQSIIPPLIMMTHCGLVWSL